jgi:hypothetical protein
MAQYLLSVHSVDGEARTPMSDASTGPIPRPRAT